MAKSKSVSANRVLDDYRPLNDSEHSTEHRCARQQQTTRLVLLGLC